MFLYNSDVFHYWGNVEGGAVTHPDDGRWEISSQHMTSEGVVTYESCRCGCDGWRVSIGSAPPNASSPRRHLRLVASVVEVDVTARQRRAGRRGTFARSWWSAASGGDAGGDAGEDAVVNSTAWSRALVWPVLTTSLAVALFGIWQRFEPLLRNT